MAEIQTWGMRRPGGRVRHIVRLEKRAPKYSPRLALCGVGVETMDLADTVGETCRNCLRHLRFNLREEGADARGG